MKVTKIVLQCSVGYHSDAIQIPRYFARGFFSQLFATVFSLSDLWRKLLTSLFCDGKLAYIYPFCGRFTTEFGVCDRVCAATISDGVDIPSVNFSDPHYYDGFLKRRKTRQKVVCYGILTLLRRKTAAAKSVFSSCVMSKSIHVSYNTSASDVHGFLLLKSKG